MNAGVLIRLLLCIFFLGALLYAFIEKQNMMTKLRLAIPQATKEVEWINQENTRLQYEIDRQESPQTLMELARRPEYRHLKHSLEKDVITLKMPKE